MKLKIIKKERRSKLIFCRIGEKEYLQLKKIAEKEGVTVSMVFRAVIDKILK